MLEMGVYVVAFCYPVVPKGKDRIRTQKGRARNKRTAPSLCHLSVAPPMSPAQRYSVGMLLPVYKSKALSPVS